jgi:dTDP-4-dehydrorhamnose 3,5-epimerase
MKIQYNLNFDYFENDKMSRVFEIFPDYFKDERGYFMEVFKYPSYIDKNNPILLKNSKWIKQINRSSSSGSVFRGFHAQSGKFCQGKLVEAVTGMVYDIIIDARPNSNTFGVSSIFPLYSSIHNRLWVPRGFLHSFLTPKNLNENVIFEYFCDNIYDKDSEINIHPNTILPNILDNFKNIMYNSNDMKKFYDLFSTFEDNNITFSKKDLNGINYEVFMKNIKAKYDMNGELWYK